MDEHIRRVIKNKKHHLLGTSVSRENNIEIVVEKTAVFKRLTEHIEDLFWGSRIKNRESITCQANAEQSGGEVSMGSRAWEGYEWGEEGGGGAGQNGGGAAMPSKAGGGGQGAAARCIRLTSILDLVI